MEQTTETQGMPFSGEIQGGEGYVVAAWGISLAVLLAYVIAVTVRLQRMQKKRQQ